jgi:hypothetical protein
MGNVNNELSGEGVRGGTSVESNASAGRETVGVTVAGEVVGVAVTGETVGVVAAGEPQAVRIKDKTTRAGHTGAGFRPIIISTSFFLIQFTDKRCSSLYSP